MPKKTQYPPIWFHITCDKEYEAVTGEMQNTYLIQSYSAKDAAKQFLVLGKGRVTSIRLATDSQIIDALRVI